MATMVDVAKTAGVSVSTVSHVVNGTRAVGADKRDRVLRAIEETSYKPDALARAMRRSSTESIGLVVSDPGEPVFAEMVHGVERASAEHGLTLLLANSAEDPARELKAIQVLLSRRVDGLILARASGSLPQVLDEIDAASTPTVLIDRLYDLELDQVGVDNSGPVIELVGHLVKLGHRHIALLAGDLAVPTLAERAQGFSSALVMHGLQPSHCPVLAGASTVDGAHRNIATLLAARTGTTALIAASTVLAAGALQALQDASLRVPEDIAFATFDGFAYADVFEPSLTTIRQPALQVGIQAMQLLVKRLAEPDAPPRTVRLAPTVEYRRSTGAR